MIYVAATALDSKDYPPAGSLPNGLDPQLLPIIASHWFGVPPAELRLQRLAENLHALGPRSVFEFCREIAEAHDIGADVQRRLERYARLNPAFFQALVDDHFPPSPIHRGLP